ncbi:hypothetical protein MKW98_016133 [Papaver atlanticum]|uniref:LOB domain-containing protein n=1 Tax=Papaver atlanticum TaxID=357466 RepID=A0AAD4T5P4_9MAGN|nr:hypothetical protein MKW98_016133 [Papaver atlanticum]
MKVHEICVFCKYRGESACSRGTHHLLFRLDNVSATFSHYNAQSFNQPVNDETKNRITDGVIRLENIVRYQDETYGLAGIILLLESILDINTAHYESLIITGQNPPTAVQIRPDYPVRPPQQTASFNNSFVSTSSAQQPQRQPCPACIYLARNCPWNCQLAQYFESMFRQDFRDVCRSLFARTSLVYNNTSQKKLKQAEMKQIGDNTRGFEVAILRICPIYGTMGIMLSLVRRLLVVNSDIDNLEGVNRSRQFHQQVPPQYPAPTNLNTGGPPQQQQQRQLQLGVAKRSLEQGESQIRQQRQRLPEPPNQPHQAAGAWPRLQKAAPFQQTYPPPAFQQPPYHVQMQGHQTRPLPRSQQSAVPSQFQPLFAGINSSSSASSSQSQLQSHRHHYLSTVSSSSAAVVGQPDPHHQPPLATLDEVQNTYWDEEQIKLNQRLQPYQVQMQGHQTRPLLLSQPPAVPSQSQQLLAGINSSSSATSSQSQQQLAGSSSSAAVVGQPHQHHHAPADPYEFATVQLPDNENTDEAQKQLNQGPQ